MYPYKNHPPASRMESSGGLPQSTAAAARASLYRPSRAQGGSLRSGPEEPSQTEATRTGGSTQHGPSGTQVGLPGSPQSQHGRWGPTNAGGSTQHGPSKMQVGFPGLAQYGRPGSTRASGSTLRNLSRMRVGFPGSAQSGSTGTAAPPQAGRSIIIRPGEPHTFGTRVDRQRGEIFSTLCRCHDPMSHGDAYTMLDSPWGNDINGKPIDWQTAHLRMLDHYKKDQISNQEQIAAIRYIFDPVQVPAKMAYWRGLQQAIRAGAPVVVNTAYNNVGWHNEDGHAKIHVTDGGLQTMRLDQSGGYAPSRR